MGGSKRLKLLLDTHIWFYLENDISKLSGKLLHEIYKSEVFVSGFSIWELSMLDKKGRLQFCNDLELWIEKSMNRNQIQIIFPNQKILIESTKLNWDHRDPADRIIVATAIVENLKLATHDKKIINSNLIEVVD